MAENNNAASNSNGNSASSGVDEDTLASFTNFGADGLDTDTTNLFGSFTNDTSHADTDESIFGQLSANDLSGFGVDLASLDMGGGDGGMDLSSIQLMNLDDVSMGGGNNAGGQHMPLADDTAQMVAQLLGPGTHATVPGTLAPATTGASAPAALHAPATAGASAPAALQAPGQPGKGRKSRSSSVSSSDMGDIPLAQLALLQPGVSAQNTAAQNALASQALAAAENAGTSQPHRESLDAPLASTLFGIPPTQGLGGAGLVSTAAPGNAQSMGVASAGVERLMASHPQLQQQQHHQQNNQQQHNQQQHNQQQHYMEQLHSAMSMQTQHSGAAARMEDALAPALNTSGTQPAAGAAVPESGTSGVESTVLLKTRSAASDASATALQLALPRPHVDIASTPLDELERIEDQLCALLGAASRAIRMLAGADAGTAGLEATVGEFMRTVATVQAELRLQHKRLVERGVPVQMVAAYQSDVAGVERDLVAWTDAADLLAKALDSGLRISS